MTDSVVSFEEEAPSAEEFAERIRSAHAWLVAERDGDVAGYAYATRHRPRAAYRWSAEVSAYIHPSAHRQGVGRALYTELLDRLRDRGFRLAVAGITLPNDASVGLHEAVGFQPVGVYHNVGRKFGEWWDVGWWELDLGDPGNVTAP